jgi:membrane dipeptidase
MPVNPAPASVYRRAVIADAHVDLLLELAHRERRLGESDVFASTWLPLLEQGGVGLQVCPVYVDIVVQPEGSLREALSQVASFHRALRENPGRVMQVTTAADLDAVEAGERIGLMLSLEGVEPFGVETWPADLFHALGVRMAGLTWNRRNAFADGAAEEGGGLSRLGRELVDRLVSLGVILDLAHASRGLFAEVLERVEGAPLLYSHGACRAVYDTPRNLDDHQLRALADAGGVLGLMLHPVAIGPDRRTLDGVVDHLEHAVSVMGADRVCLGGDFTKRLWEAMPPPPETRDGLMPPGLTPGLGIEGLTGSGHYPALLERLVARGWGEADVAAVTSGNLLRFLRASL